MGDAEEPSTRPRPHQSSQWQRDPARATDILHVDMDAFFAAVEILDDPTLAGKPVIVGAAGSRGVVASCSYEARAFGIRSAMPSTEASRLCPQAVFVAGRHGRYSEVSQRLHAIFTDFTPIVEGISLDEAFLDVRGGHRLLGSSVDIAHAIRSRVRAELHLGCSVGVARTKLVAKLASEAAKPTASRDGPIAGKGVVVVGPEEEVEFLHRLPVRAIWGIGPKTAERLRRYGVSTVGDLAAVGRDSLVRLLGAAQGTALHDLAWGRDDRAVVPDRPLKSVGHEETFAVDDRDPESLHRQAVRMADAVGARMREAGVVGRTVTVKVRFADFSTITRSQTLSGSTCSGVAMARVAAALLETVEVHRGVRLLGVSASGLGKAPATGAAASGAPVRDVELEVGSAEQLSFADAGDSAVGAAVGAGGRGGGGGDSQANLERDAEHAAALADVETAIDAVRRRYGMGAVGPASLAGPGGLEVKQRGDAQWGPGSTRPAGSSAEPGGAGSE
jgi:DNA polymerase-4